MEGFLHRLLIRYLVQGSTNTAAVTAEGLVANYSSRYRGFAIFAALLFTTVLVGLFANWPEMWGKADLLHKILFAVSPFWMLFAVAYFLIVPKNYRLVIADDGIRERIWTSSYKFTPWSDISSVMYEVAKNNVVFRKTNAKKIEVSALLNGFEEIKAFAIARGKA